MKEAHILEFSVSSQAAAHVVVFLEGPRLGGLFCLLFVQALAHMFCPFHAPFQLSPDYFLSVWGFIFCICLCPSMWVAVQDLRRQEAFRAINSIQTPGTVPSLCPPLQT